MYKYECDHCKKSSVTTANYLGESLIQAGVSCKFCGCVSKTLSNKIPKKSNLMIKMIKFSNSKYYVLFIILLGAVLGTIPGLLEPYI